MLGPGLCRRPPLGVSLFSWNRSLSSCYANLTAALIAFLGCGFKNTCRCYFTFISQEGVFAFFAKILKHTRALTSEGWASSGPPPPLSAEHLAAARPPLLRRAFLAESGVSSDNEDDDDEGDGSYLHPSLFASKKCNRLEELMKVLISLPSCVFIASQNC